MKRGHVTGTKRERKGSQDWYAAIAEANIARIEAQGAATQAQPHPAPQPQEER